MASCMLDKTVCACETISCREYGVIVACVPCGDYDLSSSTTLRQPEVTGSLSTDDLRVGTPAHKRTLGQGSNKSLMKLKTWYG
jgi:hypothetical protein